VTPLEAILDNIRHSPQLPQMVDRLSDVLAAERERRRRFYEEMTPEEKVEFIDGEVILHSPARMRHLDVTMRLATLLRAFVGCRQSGKVCVEKCLCVFPRNDYEPDIVFFGRDKADTLGPETMKFPVPDFVVEVLSESTEERDRGVKFEDYAANGVAEYWIVNAEDSVLEQYLLRDGDYELALKSSSGRVRSVVIDGFESDVAALFDDGANLAALREITN